MRSRLIILQLWKPQLGGAEVHTAQLAKFLSKNLEVFFSTPYVFWWNRYFSNFRSPSSRFNRSSIKVMEVSYAFPALYSFFLKIKPQWIILPKPVPSFGKYWLYLLIKLFEIKCIVIEHAVPPFYPGIRSICGFPVIGYSTLKKMIRYDFRLAFPHKVVCVSNYLRNRLMQSYHLSLNKSLVIYNGIDFSLFRISSSLRASLRKKFQCPSHIILGYVGRLEGIKRIDRLIKAVHVLCYQYKFPIKLFIVGEGSRYYALNRLVIELGLDDVVTFLKPCSDPWNIYPLFDFFVLPSDMESFCISLLEAVACGCFPVCTYVGGVKEILDVIPYFWSCNPNLNQLVQSLVDAVRFFMSKNSSDINRFRIENRKSIKERFDLYNNLNKYYRLLQQLN